MDSNYLAKVMELCLSPRNEERKEGIEHLQQAKKLKNFASELLKLSADRTVVPGIQQNAAIQLKNFVLSYWKVNEEIIIENEDRQIIKENILRLLPSCNSKTIFKLYLKIINTLIKNESEWKEFLQYVCYYLKSMNQFEIYCGVLIFYQMCKIYEFEIERKRDIYNECFAFVRELLENLMDGLLSGINSDNLIFSDDELHNLSMQILYKLIKIFFRTNQMGHLPRIMTEESKFDKWVNYFLFITKLNYNNNLLSKFPNNIEELEALNKSILWKIKNYCYDVLYKLFEKYGDITKTSQKDPFMLNFVNFVEATYSKVIFETFLSVLYKSKMNYIDEKIICLVYQYFQLIINRGHHILLPLLEANLDVIIKEHLIQGAILGVGEFDSMKNNTKQYIYKQYEKGHSFKSKRVAINEFLIKLSQYKKTGRKNSKGKPLYLDTIYNYLINSIQNLDNDLKVKSESQGNIYAYLMKESCLNLIESIHFKISTFYENNVEQLMINFIAEDLDKNCSHGWIRERAFSLIHNFSACIEFKNESLIQHIVNHTCKNLIAGDELIVTIKCALLIPKLINQNEKIKELFRNEIANVFMIYLKLIKELDLDQIIKCLEKLVSVYPNEVMRFSLELTKELIMAFERYTKNESEFDNEISTDINDDECEEEEETNLATACGIIKTIEKLLYVCSNNKNFELFYKIEEMIAPIINWSFHTPNIASIFVEIIELVYTIVDSSAELSVIGWSFYPLLLNSLITYEGGVQEGVGYENIERIIPIMINYIIKNPEKLILNINDSSSTNLISKTIEIIPNIISLSKLNHDEINCSYSFRVIITILETYKEKLDYILKDIIVFTLGEMKSVQQGLYKMLLLQTIALCYVYNPKLTNSIIEGMNLTQQLFEMWISQINNLRYDFEYRRTVMAFSSILLINRNELNPVISDNLSFMMIRIIELFNKLTVIRENKSKEKEEADVSGDEGSDESEENENNLRSKSKYLKSELKDFIENDMGDSEDENDEDYNELDNSISEEERNKFKTALDSQDEFLYLRDILIYLSQTNLDYHNYIISLISDNNKAELSMAFEKAEKRINKIK